MAIDPDVEQLLNDLRGQVAGLSVALNNATNRIRDLEDGLQDHIGLNWGSSLVDFNAPHPNISVDTIESGGGIIRQDRHGMQVQTGGEETPAIYAVENFLPNPSALTSTAAAAVLSGYAAGTSSYWELQAKKALNDAGTTTATVRVDGGASGRQIELKVDTNALLTVFTDGTTPFLLINQSLRLNGVISPTQITSNQNDYNPTDLVTSAVLRLSSDASRDITGLAGGADGRVLLVFNVGSNNIVLKDESASSTAANRFALNGDITLAADNSVILWYDATSSRWRAV